MAAVTPEEKLERIKSFCTMILATEAEPPADMSPSEQAYWRAIQDGYNHVASTVLNYIDHGTSRPKKDK